MSKKSVGGVRAHLLVINIFGAENESPIATNVVIVVLLFRICYCYQIFKVLKLYHFATDRN